MQFKYGGTPPKKWDIRIDAGYGEGRLTVITSTSTSTNIILRGEHINQQEVEDYILSRLKDVIREGMTVYYTQAAIEAIRVFAAKKAREYGPHRNGAFKGIPAHVQV